MANKPFYTASRKAKIAYIKELWPGEKRVTTMEQIYERGVLSKEDLIMLIEVFLDKAKENYQKMAEIENEIQKDQDED